MTLTEDEREMLCEAWHTWDHPAFNWPSADECAKCEDFAGDILPLFAEILTARLARVEALVAPVEGIECPLALFDAMYGQATDPDGVLGLSVIAAANAIRAALAAAPSREADQ